ncbi:flagellar hook-length control protein FliK [Desulfovibrio aminophilus]|uniref:flagellar hook-length control protein FliK n=1 Tax=Desulfovibrio aminophilus TaxID=81425 RepID=UPI0003F96AAE|nr:flagellar hook-length control protein FliK [Desulfovibrio aminophilus]
MQILPDIPTAGQSTDPLQFSNGLSTYEGSSRSGGFSDFMSMYSTLDQQQTTTSASSLSSEARTRIENRRAALREEAETAAREVRDGLTGATRTANPADLSPKEVANGLTKHVSLGLQSMKLSRDDLDAMRNGLKTYGLSASELLDFENQVGSSEGLTWGRFVSALSEKMRQSKKALQLSSEEVQELQSFFQKIGFNPAEAQGLVQNLSQGDASKVLLSVQSRLESQNQDRGLSLTARELTTYMNALAQAAKGASAATRNLSGGISGQLAQMAEQLASGPGTTRGLRELLGRFQGEMAQLTQNQAEKDQSLVKLVGDTLEKSARREKLWSKGDRQAQNQETMLRSERGVSSDIKNFGRRLREDAEDAVNAAKNAWRRQAENSEQELGRPINGKSSEQRDPVAELRDAARPVFKTGAETTDRQAEGKSKSEQGSGGNSAWKEFFGKLKTESGQETARLENAKTQINEFALADSPRQTTTAPTVPQSVNTAATRQMLTQVQNGVLTNLGQGRTQLTLQLQPENLGTLSVMLQVKNKEVQAVIRADNHETGKLLAANLESLRQSLEEQGLKVARMEVQTGLSGNQEHAAWLGQEQHNQAREQREALAGMKWRAHIADGDDVGLARDVLSSERQASLADRGLHLIA